VLIQRKLFDNYHSVAYVLIIGTYLIAFAEYLYLRLVSIILPQKIVYKHTCSKHLNETITRNELHYASTTIIFIVIGCFQIVVSYLPYF
jgi:putative component of membrane protein insertase Oxa1/YidC/SpoIIIJ protein YidD